MNVEIRGLDSLRSKLKKLPSIVQEATVSATYEIVEETTTRAVSRIQSSVKNGSGELAASVKNEVVKDGNGKVVGRVWSDKETAIFREFGTGPVGEASPKDLPPGVNPVYTQERWFIPVELVSVDLEAIYGIPKLKVQDKEFFVTRGQPARPWLYPSLKEGEELAPEIFKDHIRKGLNKL